MTIRRLRVVCPYDDRVSTTTNETGPGLPLRVRYLAVAESRKSVTQGSSRGARHAISFRLRSARRGSGRLRKMRDIRHDVLTSRTNRRNLKSAVNRSESRSTAWHHQSVIASSSQSSSSSSSTAGLSLFTNPARIIHVERAPMRRATNERRGPAATGHYAITVHFRLTADDRTRRAQGVAVTMKSQAARQRDAAARQWRPDDILPCPRRVPPPLPSFEERRPNRKLPMDWDDRFEKLLY